jgi:hypothetical protein
MGHDESSEAMNEATARHERTLHEDAARRFKRAPPAALHIRRRVFGPGTPRLPDVDAVPSADQDKC